MQWGKKGGIYVYHQSPGGGGGEAVQRKAGNWELGRKIFLLPLGPISGKRFADLSQDWPVKERGPLEDC